MKKTLLTLVTCITTVSTGTSFYIATLSNPTKVQTTLAHTTNTIAIAGSTAIIELLKKEQS